MKVVYSADGRNAIYCGYKFRKDKNTGYFLCTKKTDIGKRERLHCFVWRKNFGDIPDGFQIHHKDKNKDNNEIENLACIPKHEHMKLHADENARNNHDFMVNNLVENALPKAVEWHRSEQGREWHRKHSIEVYRNLEERKIVCENCGKYFMYKANNKVRFCCNNCKASARRKSGVDNIERKCVICGNGFITNKYSKTRTCSGQCKYKLREIEKR
jgi:endogenous inhibitor of DNA gyrase (YacG/DUF329 family)